MAASKLPIHASVPLSGDVADYGTCPVCSERSVFWGTGQDHHYGNQGYWHFHQCEQCGHIFQVPMPEERSLGQYYPTEYYAHQQAEYDFSPQGLKRRSIQLRLHYLKRLMGYKHLNVSGNALLSFLWVLWPFKPTALTSPPFRNGGSFLDYGCGSGQSVAFLNYLGWKGEGIEIGGRAVEIARKAGLDVQQGSIDALEPRRSRYEYIISTHCVEHVVDIKRLFHAFYSALKPGGVLFVEVPNADALSMKHYRNLFYYLGAPVHVHLFSQHSLATLANIVGFINISTWTKSVWICHYAPKGLQLRLVRDPHGSILYQHTGSMRRLQSQILSLPQYLKAHRNGRGDTLFLRAEKPTHARPEH